MSADYECQASIHYSTVSAMKTCKHEYSTNFVFAQAREADDIF